jgi:hypothetical protein
MVQTGEAGHHDTCGEYLQNRYLVGQGCQCDNPDEYAYPTCPGSPSQQGTIRD